MSISGKPYPSDVSTEELSLVVPHLLLQRENTRQREHDLRVAFNGLRDIMKTGAPWRWKPNDLPPSVYQQSQRWLAAGCFDELVDELRAVLRLAAGPKAELSSPPPPGGGGGGGGPPSSAPPGTAPHPSPLPARGRGSSKN